MLNQDSLICPYCAGNLNINDDSIKCDACDRAFPTYEGIIDFRDAGSDFTAAFSIEKDIILAKQLMTFFPHVKTFNAFFDLYQVLISLDDPNVCGSREFISSCGITERPLAPAQLAHGPDIMKKIDLHLSQCSRELRGEDLALEDGCGHGYFVEGISKRFKHVIVLDFSLCYLFLVKKLIEERGIQNAVLICASAERLPVKNASVDFVHSNNVIEHVQDQDALCSEAKRVLRGHGVLFVRSPNRYSIYKEPHFRLYAYGFIPPFIRKKVVHSKQGRDTSDIALLSLGELRSILMKYFGRSVYITFVPANLNYTITGGLIRQVILSLLRVPMFGSIFDRLINRWFLALMPYHSALCFKEKD